MDDSSSPFFSESQLSQIATMMPSLAQKSKFQSDPAPMLDQPSTAGVNQLDSTQLDSSNDETRNGILRLSDFLRRKTRAIEPPLPKTHKIVKFETLSTIDFVLFPSPEAVKPRALRSYAQAKNGVVKNGTRVNVYG